MIKTAGMRLSNGEIIYTYPLNADTDGDGVRDGDEIVIGDMKLYVLFIMKIARILST